MDRRLSPIVGVLENQQFNTSAKTGSGILIVNDIVATGRFSLNGRADVAGAMKRLNGRLDAYRAFMAGSLKTANRVMQWLLEQQRPLVLRQQQFRLLLQEGWQRRQLSLP